MKNKKVSILYVDPLIAVGGQEIYLINLIKNLNNKNYTIHLSCSTKSPFIEELKKLEGLKLQLLSYSSKFSLLSILKLRYYIRENGIQLVHLNGNRAGLLGRISCILLDTKIIFTPHSLLINYKYYINKIFFKIYLLIDRILNHFTNVLITVSDEQKKQLIKHKHITSNKVIRVYNGIDINRFKKVNIPNNQVSTTFGYVGRLIKEKGVKDLLICFEQLLNDDNNCKLLYIGDGPYLKKLNQNIFKMGIEDKVQCVGNKTQIDEILRTFDIFVLPSYAEGLPLSILEAMASELPVIASTVNGIPEIIKHNYNGLMHEPGDLKMLYNNMKYLLKNNQLRKKIGHNARNTVVKTFSLDAMIRNTENIYHAELNKGISIATNYK